MNKKPQSNSTKAQGAPQKKQQNIYVLLGITIGIFVLLVGGIMLIKNLMSSEPAPQQTSSYQDSNNTDVKRTAPTPPANGNNSGQEGGADNGNNPSQMTGVSRELKITTDPQSGVEYVETPSGTVLVSSPEGQKYIQDYKALKLEENGGVDPLTTAPTVANVSSQAYIAEINTLKSQLNEQAQALDEKINTAYEAQENMKSVINKQNETIKTLSDNLAMAQPLMRSPKEIAKELFGKQAEATLKSRNNAVKLDSVVGNKGYFTDKDGNVFLLGVGDIVPNTSLMIKAFDEGRSEAIVYK